MVVEVDWKTDLILYLEEARAKPFCWASHNCVTFMMDWVKRTSGVDPIEAFRGRNKTRVGGYRIMKNDVDSNADTSPLLAFVSKRMSECGMQTVPVQCAQNGDVAVTLAADGEDCAAIMHNGKPWGLSPKGIEPSDRDNIKLCWRIPKGEG